MQVVVYTCNYHTMYMYMFVYLHVNVHVRVLACTCACTCTCIYTCTMSCTYYRYTLYVAIWYIQHEAHTCLCLHLYSQEAATTIDYEVLDAPSDSSAVRVQKPCQKTLRVGDCTPERESKKHLI